MLVEDCVAGHRMSSQIGLEKQVTQCLKTPRLVWFMTGLSRQIQTKCLFPKYRTGLYFYNWLYCLQFLASAKQVKVTIV